MAAIKDLIKKPSDILDLMVTSLTNQGNRHDFIVDMTKFGGTTVINNQTIPCGCAAICAVQELMGRMYPIDVISNPLDRSDFMLLERKDLHLFETAVNMLRTGAVTWPFIFLGVEFGDDIVKLNNSFHLANRTWPAQLSAVGRVAEVLKQKGY